MKLIFSALLKLRLVVAVFLVSTPFVLAASTNDEVISLLSQAKAGDNFRELAYRAAMNSQTYRMIVAQTDATKAKEILSKELEKTLPKYQRQWNENLALAYLEYFTPQELHSIFTERGSSRYIKKFWEKQTDVGVSMQKKSSNLLVKAVSEAIGNAYNSVSPLSSPADSK